MCKPPKVSPTHSKREEAKTARKADGILRFIYIDNFITEKKE